MRALPSYSAEELGNRDVDNTRIHVFLPWLNEPLQIHFHPIEMNAMKYASLLYNHFRRFSHIFRSYFLCLDSILLFSVKFVYVFFRVLDELTQ